MPPDRQHQALAASLSVLAVVGLGIGIARPWSSNDTDGAGIAAASSTTESVATSSSISRAARTRPSGAEDETTLRENAESIKRVFLRQRVAVDVSKRSPATELFGTKIATMGFSMPGDRKSVV